MCCLLASQPPRVLILGCAARIRKTLSLFVTREKKKKRQAHRYFLSGTLSSTSLQRTHARTSVHPRQPRSYLLQLLLYSLSLGSCAFLIETLILSSFLSFATAATGNKLNLTVFDPSPSYSLLAYSGKKEKRTSQVFCSSHVP